jgi:hypothetical protein
MGITVNAVLPAGVNSDFIHNNAMDKVLRPDLHNQTRQDVMPLFEVAPRAAGAAGRLQSDPVPGIRRSRHLNDETLTLSGRPLPAALHTPLGTGPWPRTRCDRAPWAVAGRG